MYSPQDPDRVATSIIALVRSALLLVPDAKVMVLVDVPGHPDPCALFSELSYDRAISLLSYEKNKVAQAHEDGLKTIAAAMRCQPHG